MHESHMTRRSFARTFGLAAGVAALGGLTSCGSQDDATETASVPEQEAEHVVARDDNGMTQGDIAEASHVGHAGSGAPVYFTHAIDPDAIEALYDALGAGLTGAHIAVKLSSGEPGSNPLDPELIAGLVHAVNGTIVECNTAYNGARSTTEGHYQVASEHGYPAIADFQIMDEDGSVGLPVEGGLHLTENLVGAHFLEYDGMLVLSHFKGHQMAGFGGALKNISIGVASVAGKCRIHSAGTSDTSPWGGATAAFQESMADAAKSVIDALSSNMCYINVMNNLSVDCDCNGHPAAPKMADIGILASRDPVALDQACVDLVYEADDDSADLISRIETLNGEHVLEAAEQIGVGSRSYELIEVG